VDHDTADVLESAVRAAAYFGQGGPGATHHLRRRGWDPGAPDPVHVAARVAAGNSRPADTHMFAPTYEIIANVNVGPNRIACALGSLNEPWVIVIKRIARRIVRECLVAQLDDDDGRAPTSR
jgi:hypothetical protein